MRRDGAVAGGAVAGVVDEGAVLGGGPAQGADLRVADLHHHFLQAGKGQQEGVVDGPQEALGEILRGGVAQRHDHGGVVRVRGGALGRERQPQQRHMAVPSADLVAETGAVRSDLGGEVVGLGERPADAAVPADDGGLVGDGEDRGEADAEAAHGGVVRVPLRGGPEGGEGLDMRPRRGAPVLAATRTPSRSVRRSRPGVPARAEASAAFWASSTTSRSRYPPRTRSSSALASSRNLAGLVAQASSTPRRRRAVPNGSAPSAAGRTNLLTGSLSL